MLIAVACVLISALSVSEARAQQVGRPADANLSYQDLPRAFALPDLKDSSKREVGRAAASLQVFQRATRLKLNISSALDAWRKAGSTLSLARTRVESVRMSPASGVVFSGERVSQLNEVIRATPATRLGVSGQRLIADKPLLLTRSDFRLDLNGAAVEDALGAAQGPYLMRIEGVRNVVVTGGVFTGTHNGVLVSSAQDVTLLSLRLQSLQEDGIVVTGSSDVIVWGGHMTGIGRAPVILHGLTHHSVVAYNDIHQNLGVSNWNAGVVITDRNVDLARDPLSLFQPDHYGVVVQPIVERLTVPRQNLVAFNRIAENRASGIYLDGAVQEVISNNLIEGNAKEGLCLDNGSTANVVVLNTVEQNGKRWGNSDSDLKRDFIGEFGRLPDGSAKAKVPGVSLDNAAYNIVYANHIGSNYGGGVKMVRTSFFNLIGLNVLVSDNEGESDKFHFFGIELGAASADAPVADLDFSPSRGNLIFSNLVRGDHYAGIFFAAGSDTNDIFDNTIIGAKAWALESVKRQDNSTLNNLTNLPSRNIGPGLDPRLPVLTAARFD